MLTPKRTQTFIRSYPLFSGLVLLYALISFLYHLDWLNSYHIQLVMLVGINIVMTVSLGLINGFTGQFSIGHAGFMAVGAYTSVGMTTLLLQSPGGHLGYLVFFPATLIGGIFAAATGFLIGLPTLRLGGDYLAIVTMAFAEVIRTIIRVSEPMGGPRGIGGIPDYTNLTIVFIFAITSVWLMRNFILSTYGRASKAIRDNEIAAEIMGVNTTRQKVLVFTLGAFFAGCCGSLYAHVLQYIHPDNFTFMKSLEYLIYLYIGGSSSISGAIVGATIFTFLPELFRRFSSWRMVIYSLTLILVMLFRPEGIVGNREWRPLVSRRRRT